MNVVGKFGSLITQGVYSVATPFHPFGGAVDIIVVEQEDGTYRSTPWYVRFGKFQGVLKGTEKVVGISVNGVEADFHMFLDNSGEAYFVREVESGNEDTEPRNQVHNGSKLPDSSQDDNVDDINHRDSNGECNQEEENNRRPYGFDDECSSQQNSTGSPEYPTYYGSLDEVEDLMESSQDSNSEMVLVSVDGHVLTAPISSTEENMENLQLSIPQFHLGPGECSEEFASGRDGWEAGLFCDLDATPNCRDTLVCPLEESNEAMGPSDFDQEAHGIEGDMTERDSSSENAGLGMKGNDMFMSCLELSELTLHLEASDSQSLGSPSMALKVKDGSENSPSNHPPPSIPEIEGGKASDDCHFGNGVCAPPMSSDLPFGKELQTVNTEIEESRNKIVVDESMKNVGSDDVCAVHSCSDFPLSDGSAAINMKMDAYEKRTLVIEDSDTVGSVSISALSINKSMEQKDDAAESSQVRSVTEGECSKAETSETKGNIFSLGFEISLCGNLLHPGMGWSSADEAFEAHRITKEEFEASGPMIVKNGNLIVRFKGKYLPWDKAASIVLGTAVFGADISIDLKNAISVEEEVPQTREDTNAISPSPSSHRWRLWSIPFRRVKTLQHTNSSSSDKEVFLDSESCLQSPETPTPSSVDGNQSPRKQFLRTNIPTTEQIASLKLKDGQNIVAFNFSTRVWGKQKVDAHIYLWKWNARIVISDVDGTITKSDVLGQFMPLVGRDWTQSGVARFFSAIKENGYQLLFLSARAIVQAYLTRSFLLNLRQDGKTLPNGPVVISPDGLFPSLYREVIRRAPHEFKIACLEDIRALFPSDYNPFYAGFGNRDTDELSYRKIGIPKGKIFIINPKGEVAINHSVDVKSYTSLHMLVNDMFPPTSVAEQEDFNSWNYWKIPLASVDC